MSAEMKMVMEDELSLDILSLYVYLAHPTKVASVNSVTL
jgi:hypothetical protein